ncbi:hypothetical protein KQR54_05685 [Mycobacterium gordonae]|uniref:hypothetical protein n=1 Tax=Mycobacterium gordonae TaxID=1778 RepID=UPI00210C4056|nr:hypothetical protein [Mycobacterium gordonae]MCQ4360638.1 hypothetical protein [Mycobacterium gordonae]
MSIADLLAELAAAPRLNGALCRGHSDLFDAAERGDDTRDTAERLAYAVRACRYCPALEPCRRWFDALPVRQRPRGVTAGLINGRKPMTASPVAAALDLIRYAQRSDADAVSANTAVELAATGLDADQLRSVLRLLFPFMAELYLVKRLSKEALDRQDAQTFAELAATLGDVDVYDPDAYDSDPVGDVWRAGQGYDTPREDEH